MLSELTLRVEEKVIKRAEEYAKSQDKSLSQIVAEFFNAVSSKRSERIDKRGKPFGPITSKLVGSLKGANLNEEDYKDHLKRKYL